MQVSVETTSGLERRMTVAIPREKINDEIQTRLKSLAVKAKMPGFRPGKVPFNVIQKRYGGQVHKEVLGELVQHSFYEAVSQEKLRPAGMPHIETTEGTNDESKDVAFTATFEVYPEIELGSLSEIKIEKPTVEILDSDIDKMIDTIRKQRVEWKPIERSSKTGDRITIDFEGKIDGVAFEGGTGKAMPVELGSGRMIAGFEEQLEGLALGQEKTLSLEFPAEYHQKDLAGKPVTFDVKVTQVEEPSLPEVDDAFIKSMGVSDGSLETFREQVKSNMQREADQNISSRLKQQVLDKLLTVTAFEIPKVLVDSEIHSLQHQQEHQLGEQAAKELNPSIFEEQARRRVALGLILSEIVKQNDIKVAPAKVRGIIESLAAGYERPEEVVKYYYGDKDRLAEIENYALEGEVVDWVISKANVTENAVAFDELVNPAQR